MIMSILEISWKGLHILGNVINYFMHGGWIILAMALVIHWGYKKYKGRMRTKKTIFRDKTEGIVFGRKGLQYIYSPVKDEGHVAIYAGTGLGKTTSQLIPSLQHWTGTSFTIDISGDICKNVDMPNKMIYEPANPNSVPYNIFGTIDLIDNIAEKDEALEQLAILMMPDTNDTMSEAAYYFLSRGRRILTAALLAFYHEGLDFIPICERIMYSGWKKLFRDIEKTEHQKAKSYIQPFAGALETNVSGAFENCCEAVKVFSGIERIKKSIRRPNAEEECFTPQMLENHNVFVIIEDAKLALYAPLLHIITAQSLEFCSMRSNDAETTILFCLDEFASLGKMDIIDALRKLRKKHVRIMMLTQSISDLDLVYGRAERMAMQNNFKYIAVLGCSDSDTQEYFSKLIGEHLRMRLGTSKNGKQVTRSKTEERERIVAPSKLANLGENMILLTDGGYMKLKKNYFFKKDWLEHLKDFLKWLGLWDVKE